MNKNIIITIIAMIMCIGLATAFSGLGSGTPEDPYQISTLSELNETRNDLTANYILTSDINASITCTTPLIPIGSSGLPGWTPDLMFNGSFNGQNHTIFNMCTPGGLFGAIINPGIIMNLRLINITAVQGSIPWVGCVAGEISHGILRNIYVQGSVTGDSIGLLVGRGRNSGELIDNCEAIGTITATGCNVGGLTSQMYGIINNSYALTNITGGGCSSPG